MLITFPKSALHSRKDCPPHAVARKWGIVKHLYSYSRACGGVDSRVHINKPAVQERLLYGSAPVSVPMRPWPLNVCPAQYDTNMSASSTATLQEAARASTSQLCKMPGLATMVQMLRACTGAHLSSA